MLIVRRKLAAAAWDISGSFLTLAWFAALCMSFSLWVLTGHIVPFALMLLLLGSVPVLLGFLVYWAIDIALSYREIRRNLWSEYGIRA